jgi:hypothetical protein
MTTAISRQPVTALTVTRATGREYQLTDEHGRVCASLRGGWPVRRGEISIEQDAGRCVATYGAGHRRRR